MLSLGFLPKLIKIAPEKFRRHITSIFNCSINQGIFLDKLKIGLTHTILKNKSALTIEQYLFYLYSAKLFEN